MALQPPPLGRLSECKIPSLPKNTMELIDLVQEADCQIPKLVKTIEQDPGLATKLVRLANSSIFGLRREVRSIQQAVVMLGLKQVRSTALSVALTAAIPRRSNMRKFGLCWQRVMTNAITARKLAGIHQVDPQEAYLTGMLQEFGILVLASAIPDQYDATIDQAVADCQALHVVERHHLLTDHAQFGGYVLAQWKLPEKLVNEVAEHHAVDQLKQVSAVNAEPMHRTMAASEIVSDLLTNPNEPNLHRYDLLIQVLGPSGLDLDLYLQELDLQLQEMSKLLDMPIDSERRLAERLHQLREVVAP